MSKQLSYAEIEAEFEKIKQGLAELKKEEALKKQRQNKSKQLWNDVNMFQYPPLQQPIPVNFAQPAWGYPAGAFMQNGPAGAYTQGGGYPVGHSIFNGLARGYPADTGQQQASVLGLDAQQSAEKLDFAASNQDVLSMDFQQQQHNILSMDAQHQQLEVPRTDAQQPQQQSVVQPYQHILTNLGDDTTQLPCSAAEQAAETGMTSTLHTSQLQNVQVTQEARSEEHTSNSSHSGESRMPSSA